MTPDLFESARRTREDELVALLREAIKDMEHLPAAEGSWLDRVRRTLAKGKEVAA